MSTDHSTNFEGSEYELDALTSELDQLHHDQGDARSCVDATEAMRGSSRRTFLLGAGAAVAGGAALVAVGTPALSGLSGVAGASTRRLAASRLPAGGSERRPGGGRGGGQPGEPGRLRLHGRAQRGGRRQAGHGPSGGGHLRHDGQGPAPAARRSLERGPQVARQGAGDGDQPEAHPDGAVGLRQGDRRDGTGRAGPDARDHRGPDLPGRDGEAEEQCGHRAVVVDPTGRDAAHRCPLLRAGQVPGGADVPRARRSPSTRRARRPERCGVPGKVVQGRGGRTGGCGRPAPGRL